ncbi:hypothetical protein F5Y12DRAFT_469674 [Xylaria sp. FL1777]|nr:hypothetical protein F5Y12DRAFT_469674 [Xylaria sp. FL1777]
MASAGKPRQPRLRASCDGCFLAKVKCSKNRPVCSRCLSSGIICNYSPSSRSGKSKPDNNHSSHSNPPHDQQMRALMEDKSMEVFMQQTVHDNNVYPLQTSWPTPPTNGVEDSMGLNPSLTSGFPLLGMNETTMNEHDPMSAPSELYSLPWGPSADIACTTFPEMSVPATHMQGSHTRSHSFDAAIPMTIPMQMQMPIAWSGPTQQEVLSYSQVQTPTSIASNYFPSPSATPINQSILSYQQSGGHCTCFAVCLQSLMNLHNISAHTQPNFDIVLHHNQKAVDACFSMLTCTTCLSKPQVDTATMLLATTIGKIASVYKSTTHSYAECGPMPILEGSLGSAISNINIGPYQFGGGGKWSNMDSLANELRKLEELFAKFREVCKDVFIDDPDISKAVINYAGQSIGSTVGAVDHRKVDTNFVA